MTDPIDDSLETVRRRVRDLEAQAATVPDDARDVVEVALEELTTALEELHVSIQETQEQQRELERLQVDLAGERNRYEQLFEWAPDGYLVTDEHGIVREANRAAQQLLGSGVRGIVGKPLTVFIGEDDRRGLFHVLTRARASPSYLEWEATVEPAMGEPFPAAFTVSAHDEAEGSRVLRWLVRDVTDQVRRADDLRRAMEVASEAEESQRAFLLAVAHDLRSPLNAILAAARSLDARRSELAEPARKSVGLITASTETLRRMQTQFLDLERLGRRGVRVFRRRTDLADLVERSVAGVDLGERTVDVELDATEAVVDAGIVEAIVFNLVDNAARHTPRTAQIGVRLQRVDEGILLTVEDDGPGVPPALRDAVFGLFQQGREERSGGLGAGLYLVRRFAELHGGRAWVEESETGGAAFHVLIAAG